MKVGVGYVNVFLDLGPTFYVPQLPSWKWRLSNIIRKNNKYVKHLYTTRKRYKNTQDDRTKGAKVYWLKFLCIHMTPEPWALKQKKNQHHIPRLMKN